MLRLLFLLCIFATLAAAQVEIKLVKEMDELDQTNVVLKNEFWEGSQWTWRLDPEAEPRSEWERHRDLGQTFTAPKTFWLDKFYYEVSNGANSPENLDACENAPVHCLIVEFDPDVAVPDSKVPPIDTLTHQAFVLPANIDSAEIADYGLGMLMEWDIEPVQLEEGKFYGILMQFDSLRANQYMQVEKTHGHYQDGTMLVIYFDGSDGRDNVTEWQWSHGGHGSNPVRDLRFFLMEDPDHEDPPPAAVEEQTAPTDFVLSPNHPNPFNPQTQITFSLPKASDVTLQIFSVDGKLVRTLNQARLTAGSHTVTWDGLTNVGQQAATGAYVYRLQADGNILTEKMTLLR